MAMVTLLTDFGDAPYPGIMKGVILSLAPQGKVVDLYHHVPMGNVTLAAYVLYHSFRHFPPGTVHVAVVDPGVGSDRRVLLAQVEKHLFVVPDNGVLTLVLGRLERAEVFVFERWEFALPQVSATFHGRDVFAPLGAWLARRVPLPMLGRPVRDVVMLDLPCPQWVEGRLVGEVLWVDPFGNLVANIEREMLGEHRFGGVLAGRKCLPLCSHYGELPSGQPGAIWNSWDLLEVFVNKGSASMLLGLKEGDPVEVLSHVME